LVLALIGLSVAYRGDYPKSASVQRAPQLAALTPNEALAPSDRSVVMLVFDGLAPGLIRSVKTPNLGRLAREGAHTLAMRPVFPTLSMPNHTSLSTGCYPERHGIVSNHFIDPSLGLYADKSNASWLEGCEHLSEVLERQGVRVSVFGWMGTHRGATKLMTHGGPFEEPGLDIEERIDQVIAAIGQKSDARSRFIVGYMDEPDHVLHYQGLEAEEAKRTMARVDAGIGRVLAAIERAGIAERTTLIVTTDHGMVPVGTHLNVEGMLRRRDIDALVAADGSIAHVYLADPSTRDDAVKKLRELPQLDVIVPESAPAWAHLGRSQRLGDLMLSAKPPYYMFDRGFWPKHLRFGALIAQEEMTDKRFAGMHGYPPDTPGVEAVFFARGAGIAAGAKLEGLRTIDVHPTIAALLSVKPGAPVDGEAFTRALAPVKDDGSEVLDPWD
jgi:predicted AlkP superfamily pyrophosphatase or phosphodiesterase